MKLSAKSVQQILEQDQNEELSLRPGREEGIAPGNPMLHKLEGIRKFKAKDSSDLRAAHQKSAPRHKGQ